MLKLTRRSEYGLIALRHLALAGRQAVGQSDVAAAKEMSDCYGIPLPLLAKVLQQLAREGFVESEQGARGGYRLARAASLISVLDVIRAIDGPVVLTSCSMHGEDCGVLDTCTVKAPLRRVQDGILKLLANISVADLAHLGEDGGVSKAGPLYQLQPRPAAMERV
jgi:Rrf2 family protein